MAYYETLAMSGRLTIELRDLNGQLIHRLLQPNLITDAGKKLVAQLFTGETAGNPELSIAVGNSTEPAKTTDVKLGTSLAEVAVSSLGEIKMTTVDGVQRAVANVTASFPALETAKKQVLNEAGIMIRFPKLEPVLYNHVNFADITRTDNLEMTLTWEVLF
jgi:hypothetical protein